MNEIFKKCNLGFSDNEQLFSRYRLIIVFFLLIRFVTYDENESSVSTIKSVSVHWCISSNVYVYMS
jgi:hypothetical protein